MAKTKTINSKPPKKPIPLDTLITYCGNVDLSDAAAERNQFIYASQLYGTFFSIYAIFKCSDVKGSPKKRGIDKIIFNLLNYKGPIDIGLEKAEFVPGDSINKDMFHLYVKGLNDPDKQFEIDFGKNPLIVSRGDELNFLRKLVKLASAPSKKDSYHVFDSEFYSRDGMQKLPKIRFEEMDRADILSIMRVDENKKAMRDQGNYSLGDVIGFDNTNNIGIACPSPRCVPATLRVVF